MGPNRERCTLRLLCGSSHPCNSAKERPSPPSTHALLQWTLVQNSPFQILLLLLKYKFSSLFVGVANGFATACPNCDSLLFPNKPTFAGTIIVSFLRLAIHFKKNKEAEPSGPSPPLTTHVSSGTGDSRTPNLGFCLQEAAVITHSWQEDETRKGMCFGNYNLLYI